MIVHELKTNPEPFQAVLDGRKTAEFRNNDRCFEVGDILALHEYDSKNLYTGRKKTVRVTHIVCGPDYGIPEGYCMLSFSTKMDNYPYKDPSNKYW